MIKRLIFDVDSTLIVGVSFTTAVENTLKELGMYSESNVENFFKGISTYEGIYTSYNYSDYKKHMEECLGISLPDNYLEVFFNNLKYVIPERNEKLINTIDALSKKYELVLLTNYFSVSQLNRLNNMGIGKYFIEAYGEDLIKPNKGAYTRACGNNKPEECVMIGDGLYLDVECAKKEGLKAIFVNTKNIPTDGIEDIVIDKVEDITEDIINKLK